MAKIFISHSSRNQELVLELTYFLQNGMGIERAELFCSSLVGTLPTGEPFIERIREQLRDCEVVILLLTEEYLDSSFCLTEMGAAWACGKRIYPLALVGMEALARTPLSGLQMRRLDNADDLSAVYDELCASGLIRGRSTAEYMRRLPVFVQQVKAMEKRACQSLHSA